MTGLAAITIQEASALLQSREISPVELVKSALDRIERLSEYHAFLLVDAEKAIAQARCAENAFLKGEVRGPMQGIPYALKDNIDALGFPTTCHSKVLGVKPAKESAFVAGRLEAAGAVMIGKLALHEFARGGSMWDLPWPPARNPWDRERHPGGSSSGAGVAVAAGMVPAAIGTDTGGSVRHPATACGIVGLKPTYGTISRRGIFPLAFSLDSVGPLTRTVEDNAILFATIAGHDVLDVTSSSKRLPSCLAQLKLGVRGMRIGVVEHFYRDDLVADPELVQGIDAAVRVFQDLGAKVDVARLSPLPIWNACGDTILQSESYAVHQKWLNERPQDYSPTARSKLLSGAFIPAVKYIRAQQMRTMLRNEFDELMRGYDVLITLSSMELPAAIEDESAIKRTYGRSARMPFNVTGTPAIAVPAGLGKTGLPLGIQIAAKAFDEATLYRAAWAFCAATGSTELRPQVFGTA